MSQQHQFGISCWAHVRVPQHLQIAIGISKGNQGPASDVQVDIDRFALFVIRAADFGKFRKNRLSVPYSKLRLTTASNHSFHGNGIDVFGGAREPWPSHGQ